MLHFLIEYGAKVDYRDSEDAMTPLMSAVYRKNGAAVETRYQGDRDEDTAKDIAAVNARGDFILEKQDSYDSSWILCTAYYKNGRRELQRRCNEVTGASADGGAQ